MFKFYTEFYSSFLFRIRLETGNSPEWAYPICLQFKRQPRAKSQRRTRCIAALTRPFAVFFAERRRVGIDKRQHVRGESQRDFPEYIAHQVRHGREPGDGEPEYDEPDQRAVVVDQTRKYGGRRCWWFFWTVFGTKQPARRSGDGSENGKNQRQRETITVCRWREDARTTGPERFERQRPTSWSRRYRRSNPVRVNDTDRGAGWRRHCGGGNRDTYTVLLGHNFNIRDPARRHSVVTYHFYFLVFVRDKNLFFLCKTIRRRRDKTKKNKINQSTNYKIQHIFDNHMYIEYIKRRNGHDDNYLITKFKKNIL